MLEETTQPETMELQTLMYAGDEWMRVNDIIEWLKIHGERKVIPLSTAHLLVKALIRMKNTKP